MVRLKDTTKTYLIKLHIFQFHYGTIKRAALPARWTEVGKFQFHYGTIKRIYTRTKINV